MIKSDLDDLALSLLECWRRFLVEVVHSEFAESRYVLSSFSDSDEEGLGDFIDIVEVMPVEMLQKSDDRELASALRLMLELNSLLDIGLEEAEHYIALDTFSLSMMRLAAIMRQRGHRCALPKVKLR